MGYMRRVWKYLTIYTLYPRRSKLMEIFIVQINKHSFNCATIMSSIEGGFVVEYNGILYKVFGKEPGSTITPEDLKA
jgi:hypothetical protein